MSPPPLNFIEDFFQMRERIEWAQAALRSGRDISQAKTIVHEFQTFYDRWRKRLGNAALGAGLDELRGFVDKLMSPCIEAMYLEQLLGVIEARRDWWIEERLFEFALKFIKLMKLAPPQMRPRLEQIHRRYMEKEFDPETHYRAAEASVAQEEAKFRKALAGLEVDWPVHVDGALRERLEKFEKKDAEHWQAEVQQKLDATTDRLKSLRRKEEAAEPG